MTRVCKVCGLQYEGDKYKTMCPDCAKKAKLDAVVRPRECQRCGGIFDGGPRAWYCPKCREERAEERYQKYRKNRKNGYNRHLGDTDYCEICGEAYIVVSGPQRYCPDCASKACKKVDRQQALDWMHKQPDAYRAEALQRKSGSKKVCVVCGKEFDAPGSPTVVCSEKCKAERDFYWRAVADFKRGKRKKQPENPFISLSSEKQIPEYSRPRKKGFMDWVIRAPDGAEYTCKSLKSFFQEHTDLLDRRPDQAYSGIMTAKWGVEKSENPDRAPTWRGWQILSCNGKQYIPGDSDPAKERGPKHKTWILGAPDGSRYHCGSLIEFFIKHQDLINCDPKRAASGISNAQAHADERENPDIAPRWGAWQILACDRKTYIPAEPEKFREPARKSWVLRDPDGVVHTCDSLISFFRELKDLIYCSPENAASGISNAQTRAEKNKKSDNAPYWAGWYVLSCNGREYKISNNSRPATRRHTWKLRFVDGTEYEFANLSEFFRKHQDLIDVPPERAVEGVSKAIKRTEESENPNSVPVWKNVEILKRDEKVYVDPTEGVEWEIRDPKGTVYHCTNLTEFFREHSELASDVPLRASRKILKAVRETLAGNTPKKAPIWKGWIVLSYGSFKFRESAQEG